MSAPVVITNMLDAYTCDRCGAAAFYMTALIAHGELFWCAHHFREHAAALEPLTEYTVDETHRLLESRG
jgi:hypothetical protein